MLQRKREALLLLAKDLEQCMRERDQLRSLVKKFVSTCECSAGSRIAAETKEFHFGCNGDGNGEASEMFSGMSREHEQEIRRQKSIITELIKQKRELSEEIKQLQGKNMEAHEDIKLLRETVARQRVGSSSGTTNFSQQNGSFSVNDISNTQGRLEILISELESVKLRNDELEQELFAFREQNKEEMNEKEFYVSRSERLNQELNHILGGDKEKAIVDIDALALENNHLKTQLAQLKCEKEILQAHYVKLKQVNGKVKPNPKRSDKSIFQKVSQKTASITTSSTSSANSGVAATAVGKDNQCRFLSTKEVQNYLMGSPGKAFPVTSKTVEELHTLALSLTETIEEKNLSLSHQKSTNKALGVRVSELENKLKSIDNSAIRNCSERLKLADQRHSNDFAFFTASFEENCDDLKHGEEESKLLYSEIPTRKNVTFDKSASVVGDLSDETETLHCNMQPLETISDVINYATNGESMSNDVIYGHFTQSDVTADDATNDDVTIDDTELEKCLSDWAKQSNGESQSNSPIENDVPPLEKLLITEGRDAEESLNGVNGVTNSTKFEETNYSGRSHNEDVVDNQNYISCSYFDELESASKKSRKGFFAKSRSSKSDDKQETTANELDDDPVFNKFFSSIDSQLSNELTPEIELDQINLN